MRVKKILIAYSVNTHTAHTTHDERIYWQREYIFYRSFELPGFRAFAVCAKSPTRRRKIDIGVIRVNSDQQCRYNLLKVSVMAATSDRRIRRDFTIFTNEWLRSRPCCYQHCCCFQPNAIKTVALSVQFDSIEPCEGRWTLNSIRFISIDDRKINDNWPNAGMWSPSNQLKFISSHHSVPNKVARNKCDRRHSWNPFPPSFCRLIDQVIKQQFNEKINMFGKMVIK